MTEPRDERPTRKGPTLQPITSSGDVRAELVALPYPPELPAGLSSRPRILQLIDGDAVSCGLAEDTSRGRAPNREVRACLGLAHATARAIDPRSRTLCAASTATATHHLDVMIASGGNTWLVRHRVDGAQKALLEELANLIEARVTAHRPRRNRQGGQADLVMLVARDRIYSPAVRQLRLLGVPTWILVPGLLVAADLHSAACASTFINPRGSGASRWLLPSSPCAGPSGRKK
jgi:hypothetical protein